MNPYTVLNVSIESDDSLIKQAYLRKVQEYPPDRHPEIFKRIRKAYEAISTVKERAKHRLFACDQVEADEIAEQLLKERRFSRPTRIDFSEMFALGLKNFTLAGEDRDGC